VTALQTTEADVTKKKQNLEEDRKKAVTALQTTEMDVAKKKQNLEGGHTQAMKFRGSFVNQRNSSGVKTANQGLTNVRNEMRKVQGSSTPLNSNNNSVTSRSNRSISISSVSSIGSVGDLTKSSDPLEQKVAANNLLVKQSSNKTPVVIPKASPTEGESAVKRVIPEASNVLREQNIPKLATSKQSKVIDPAVVKTSTVVTKAKVTIPAATSTNNAKPQPNTQHSLPRRTGVQGSTKNIRK
jgi:hypothetical protein